MAIDKDLLENNMFTRDDLLSQGIYELRKLGREVGVPSPTTLKKEQLVEAILAVIYGEKPKRNVGKGRGRPVREGNKPCKLFLNLIDEVKEPENLSTFVYDKKEEDLSFNYGGLLSSRVASPSERYNNDAKDSDVVTLKQGVVCVEGDEFYVRRYKFIPTDEDLIIPRQIVEDYCLKDNDLIEYLPDENREKVDQLIKVNGHLASRLDKLSNEKLNPEIIEIDSNIKIKSNASNIIYAPSASERQYVTDEVDKVLFEHDFKVVKVCFDRNNANADENSMKRSLYFVDAVGDEYDTMSAIEAGINKAKFYDCLGGKTALIIDNLSWLISVVNSYPKSVYGNFIAKLGKMSKVANANITVVCVTSHLSNELIKELMGMFDNIVVNEPLDK